MAGTTNMPDLKTRLTLDITDFTRGLVDARAQAGLFSREIEGVAGHFKTAGVAMATFATVSLFTAGIVATAFMSAIGVLMTLGAVSAFQAQSVQVAWAQTGQVIRMGMLDTARAYIPVLERLAVRTQQMFVGVQPALTQIFDVLAPLFEDLSSRFLGWFGGLVQEMPGMVNAALAFLFSLGPAFDAMTDNMRAGWNTVYDAVLTFGPALMQNALPPFGNFVGALLALLAPVIESASEFAGPFLDSLATIAGAAHPLLRDILGEITPELIQISGVLADMGLGVAAMLNGIEGPVDSLLHDLVEFGTIAASTFADLNPTLLGLIQAASNTGHELMPVVAAIGAWLVEFGPLAVALANMITAMVRGFVTGIQPLLDAFGVDWSSGMVTAIEDITPAMENLALIAGKFFVVMVTGAGIVISALGSIVNAVAMLTGMFNGTGFNAGSMLVAGIIAGIAFMVSPLLGVVASMVLAVAAFLPRSPAEMGPLSGDGSPDARGAKLGEMFAEGIASSQDLVTAAAAKLAGSVALPSQPNAIGTSTMPSSSGLSGMLGGYGAGAASVVINVAGSILSEKELQGLVQTGMLQRESRNAGSVFATSVRG